MPVYEEYFTPSRRKPAQLSDVVPWRSMIGPGVMLQKLRHGLQRSYAVRGPDVMGLTPEVQGALMLQVNEVVKRLGGRWMVQPEAQRQTVTSLPKARWPHPLLNLLDEEHRQRLLQDPGSLENAYYMTLTWWPPDTGTRRAMRLLVSGERPDMAQAAEAADDRLTHDERVSLIQFVREADYFMDLLKGMLATCRPLTMDETTTYLHNCVSNRWHTVGPMAFYQDLDAQLCDTPLWGGWYPVLGNPETPGAWHLRTCSLMGYPSKSVVGMLRHLDAAGFPYRWCTRWVGLEKYVQSQLLRKTQGAWVGQERSIMARMAESWSNTPTRILNTDATNKAEEVDAARQEVGANVVVYGEFTSTFHVWDTHPRVAEDKLAMAMKTFANEGFTVTDERAHATAAFLSSQPGDRRHNVHRSHHNSLFLAHVGPGMTAAWPGPSHDEHLRALPWFFVHTEFNTLFRVVNHIRDLGHFLILGKTRSGKSVLANFLRACWMQYTGAQAKVFDLDGSARLLTYLLGGQWHDLGSASLRLQPLRYVDDLERRSLALQWLLDLVADFEVPVRAPTQAYLGRGLAELAKRPPQARTFSELLRILTALSTAQEISSTGFKVDAAGIARENPRLVEIANLKMDIRWALDRFTSANEFGGIFDGDEDVLGMHPVQTFELRNLLKRPRLMGPVLGYVFPEIERQMRTDHPMYLLLDDAAVAWLTPEQDRAEEGDLRKKLERKLRDWLMTSAKKNVSLGIATHSISQVFSSPLGPLLEEGCPSRFFMPTTEALEPAIAKIYGELGLTEGAIKTIATSRPQQDVYYACRELGQRPFHLPLGPLGVACFARNRAEDHELMDAILAQEGLEGFAPAWLRTNGFEKEAAYVATQLAA